MTSGWRDLDRRHGALLGVAGAVLLAGLVVAGLARSTGRVEGGYRLHAVFPSSSQGLFTDGGTDVKLRGVNVGVVDGIELLPDGRARLTLAIDDGVRVPRSTTAGIEPLSVFGPKFVRLDPGPLERSGPWLADGDAIRRTTATAELTGIIHRVTDLFEGLDGADLLAVGRALSEGFGGLGDEAGTAIDGAAELATVGARHAGDLGPFLTDVAAVAGTLADHTDGLTSTAAALRDLLPRVHGHAGDLDELLAVTADVSSTFAGLLDRHRLDFDATVTAVADLVHGIHEESGALPDILDLLGTFFGRLSDVIRFDGPPGTGTQMAALRGFIALDLCLFLDICPEGG